MLLSSPGRVATRAVRSPARDAGRDIRRVRRLAAELHGQAPADQHDKQRARHHRGETKASITARIDAYSEAA